MFVYTYKRKIEEIKRRISYRIICFHLIYRNVFPRIEYFLCSCCVSRYAIQLKESLRRDDDSNHNHNHNHNHDDDYINEFVLAYSGDVVEPDRFIRSGVVLNEKARETNRVRAKL